MSSPPIPCLIKQPSENRSYSFDFSAFPEIADNLETIATAGTVASSPVGPTLGTPAVSGDAKHVLVRISGGTAGTVYKITLTGVITSGGNTLEGEFQLVVRDL